MIPRIIHQTSGPHVPQGGQECFDSVKRHHTDWDIRFYSDQEMYSVLGLKKNERIGVEASDLFRLKILWEQGGWYLDADMYAIGTLPTEEDHYICYEEPGWMPHKVICNWAIGVEPKNPFIKECLDEGLRRLPDTGINVLYRTGPAMMSQLYERGDWGFTPHDWQLIGSRKFDRMDRSRFVPKEAKALHLFMGCWYRENWAGGFLPKVRMVEQYEKAFRTCS